MVLAATVSYTFTGLHACKQSVLNDGDALVQCPPLLHLRLLTCFTLSISNTSHTSSTLSSSASRPHTIGCYRTASACRMGVGMSALTWCASYHIV